jgi:hypothetical protein
LGPEGHGKKERKKICRKKKRIFAAVSILYICTVENQIKVSRNIHRCPPEPKPYKKTNIPILEAPLPTTFTRSVPLTPFPSF